MGRLQCISIVEICIAAYVAFCTVGVFVFLRNVHTIEGVVVIVPGFCIFSVPTRILRTVRIRINKIRQWSSHHISRRSRNYCPVLYNKNHPPTWCPSSHNKNCPWERSPSEIPPRRQVRRISPYPEMLSYFPDRPWGIWSVLSKDTEKTAVLVKVNYIRNPTVERRKPVREMVLQNLASESGVQDAVKPLNKRMCLRSAQSLPWTWTNRTFSVVEWSTKL